MRHLIVGALLVLAGLAITSVTATLLERAAVTRRDIEPQSIIVQGPPALAPLGRPQQQGDPGRHAIFASHRIAAGPSD